MASGIDFEQSDLIKLARAIERDCQEGVRWERRKLEWILAEETRAVKEEKASDPA